jgi:hypothetical protein
LRDRQGEVTARKGGHDDEPGRAAERRERGEETGQQR